MLSKKVLGATAGAEKLYVEDVASVYLYTGNGSTQTITNNVDLSGEGGLVWIKSRSAATDHQLFDTARGATKELISNSTAAEATDSDTLTAFNADGFSLGADSNTNTNAATYASFTFRKAPKFFDVVTYTGNGVAGRTVAHNLGSVPGMIVIKRTGTTAGWQVYHRSTGNTDGLILNSTAATQAVNWWNNTSPTSTEFTLGSSSGNNSGETFVAYLFAHNAGGFGDAGTDNIISCGSFTADSTGNATVNLGYEFQYLLYKSTNTTGDWYIVDTMRGASFTSSVWLYANSSGAEIGPGGGYWQPNATGFSSGGTAPFNPNGTYIYMAIRRPMKTPTSGTEVHTPGIVGINGTPAFTTSFPPDFFFSKSTGTGGWQVMDRLRGKRELYFELTNAEDPSSMDLYQNGAFNLNWTGYRGWAFKRAPGFFDIVCYTGTGSARTVTHNLGVAPELMIVKRRDSSTNWQVYSSFTGATNTLLLNTNDPAGSDSTIWNNTAPTASVFTVGTGSAANASGGTYVAYLFATLAGVSKVGSYTGNGSSQTINCGFSAGARFVLIKRTDSTGDWCVFDTARGIVSGNDPFLQLNSTAAEVTGEDAVDPTNSGFIVNETTEALNTNGATYIFLAVA